PKQTDALRFAFRAVALALAERIFFEWQLSFHQSSSSAFSHSAFSSRLKISAAVGSASSTSHEGREAVGVSREGSAFGISFNSRLLPRASRLICFAACWNFGSRTGTPSGSALTRSEER